MNILGIIYNLTQYDQPLLKNIAYLVAIFGVILTVISIDNTKNATRLKTYYEITRKINEINKLLFEHDNLWKYFYSNKSCSVDINYLIDENNKEERQAILIAEMIADYWDSLIMFLNSMKESKIEKFIREKITKKQELVSWEDWMTYFKWQFRTSDVFRKYIKNSINFYTTTIKKIHPELEKYYLNNHE